MHVRFAYGTDTLLLDIPDGWVGNRALRSRKVDAVTGFASALDQSLRVPSLGAPLAEHLLNAGTACLAVDLADRPDLLMTLLPEVLLWIRDRAGYPLSQLTLILTRPLFSWHEMPDPLTFLAPDLIPYRVERLSGESDGACQSLGVLPPNLPLSLHREWVSASKRILLSTVEPSLLWGYGGGRASVMPGLAGTETRRQCLSDPERLNHANARPGIIRSNPFHLLSIEAMDKAAPDFGLYLTLTSDGRVAGMFSGDPTQAHLAAVNDLRDRQQPTLPEAMDIVITSGGGAPFDDTLADTVRSMVSAAQLLRHEGTLVVFSRCTQGIGPAELASLLREFDSPSKFFYRLGQKDFSHPYAWIAHQLHALLASHEVLFYSQGLSQDDQWGMGLTPVPEPVEAISLAMETHGQDCKIAVIPEGCRTLVLRG